MAGTPYLCENERVKRRNETYSNTHSLSPVACAGPACPRCALWIGSLWYEELGMSKLRKLRSWPSRSMETPPTNKWIDEKKKDQLHSSSSLTAIGFRSKYAQNQTGLGWTPAPPSRPIPPDFCAWSKRAGIARSCGRVIRRVATPSHTVGQKDDDTPHCCGRSYSTAPFSML